MKLIYKIGFTLILIWLLLVGLNRLYDFALLHNANIKAAYVQKAKINADVLIHGPCVPLWMISPELLDKQTGLSSYNLALSHSDFTDNFLHLYFYLKHNKAPRYLFLYVTPESMDVKYNTFNTYRFAPFVGDPIVDSVLLECDPKYYRWTKIPFMKYAYYGNKINFDMLQGLKHAFTGRTLPHFVDGCELPVQVEWDNNLEEFIQLYPQGYQFVWNPVLEKYLRKTIALAQQHHIQVYLYESPILKEALPYHLNRKEMVKKIKDIASDFDIEYVQFQNMKIADSRECYFSSLNTNLKGSHIFTDSLGCYIKQLKK